LGSISLILKRESGSKDVVSSLTRVSRPAHERLKNLKRKEKVEETFTPKRAAKIGLSQTKNARYPREKPQTEVTRREKKSAMCTLTLSAFGPRTNVFCPIGLCGG